MLTLSGLMTERDELVVSAVVEAILMAHHLEHDADVVVALTAARRNMAVFEDTADRRVAGYLAMLQQFARGDREFTNLLRCAGNLFHALERDR